MQFSLIVSFTSWHYDNNCKIKYCELKGNTNIDSLLLTLTSLNYTNIHPYTEKGKKQRTTTIKEKEVTAQQHYRPQRQQNIPLTKTFLLQLTNVFGSRMRETIATISIH